jgi:hypothetical protein
MGSHAPILVGVPVEAGVGASAYPARLSDLRAMGGIPIASAAEAARGTASSR